MTILALILLVVFNGAACAALGYRAGLRRSRQLYTGMHRELDRREALGIK